MNGLDWAGAVQDMQGAVNYLRAQGCTSVGAVGMCMGGALSLAAACLVKDLDAAVVFYGIPGAALCDPAKIQCPVQCHFGEDDALAGFSDAKAQTALEAKLKENKTVTHEFYRYAGAGHAFTNETREDAFNAAACKLAFKRVDAFFSKQLRGGKIKKMSKKQKKKGSCSSSSKKKKKSEAKQ
jgi:carboxymethylenebutenolidase